jgi:hypothetical protein
LAGKTFDCVFSAFTPRLTIQTADEMRVQATIGDQVIDETVKVTMAEVRPGLVLVAWTEANGNFVVQLQDHHDRVVHNHARLANGQVFSARGEIVPVQLS